MMCARFLLLLCGCLPCAALSNWDKDFVLVDGDIQVREEEGRDGEGLSASATSRQSQIWPLGVVRYVVETVEVNGDGVVPLAADDVRISRAIDNWEAKTCIRFSPCASEDTCAIPYIRFVAGTGCSSPVGAYSTRANTIYLAVGCSTGATIHEIGHSMGLLHEQMRKDRDEYVVVDLTQVEPGYAGNFGKMSSTTGRDIGKYDYGSIMHYGSDAFAIGSAPTIIAPVPIGQRGALSAGDVEAVDFLYNGCAATYAQPVCLPSVDVAQTHLVVHSKPWNMDFNVMYDTAQAVTVTYAGTTAPAGEMAYSRASGSSMGSIGFTQFTFTPSAARAGQTFTLSATFTAPDGTAATCAITVRVAVSNTVCYGIEGNDPNVCSGHGTCVDDLFTPCQCNAGYAGVDCSGTTTCPTDYLHSFDGGLPWKPFGGTSVSEDSAFFAAGGSSMRVGDVGSTTRAQSRLELAADSMPHRMTFSFAAMAGAQETPQLRLRRGTKSCVRVDRGSTGVWRVGGAEVPGTVVQTEKFYAVVVDLDWAAFEYTVSIDGVFLATSTITTDCTGGADVVIFFGNGWLDEFMFHCTVPSVATPVTLAPATNPPGTSAPVTNPPATNAPATSAPATNAPATNPPVTNAPATSSPATASPTSSPPGTTVSPATSAPVTNAPTTNPPATHAPDTSAPGTDAPATSAPSTNAPPTNAPPTAIPSSSPPGTTIAPVTQAPATDAPDTATPTSAPATTLTPATVTSAPARTTQAPAGTTNVPSSTTDAPTTSAPTLTTNAPATGVPLPVTDVPVSTPAPEDGGEGVPTAIVAGVVVGGVSVLLIGGAVVYYCVFGAEHATLPTQADVAV